MLLREKAGFVVTGAVAAATAAAGTPTGIN
jgi:hypothetical protein